LGSLKIVFLFSPVWQIEHRFSLEEFIVLMLLNERQDNDASVS